MMDKMLMNNAIQQDMQQIFENIILIYLCLENLTIIYGVSVCLFVRELLRQFACDRRQTPQSFSAAPVKYTKGVGVSF